jgi:hypothetical protein
MKSKVKLYALIFIAGAAAAGCGQDAVEMTRIEGRLLSGKLVPFKNIKLIMTARPAQRTPEEEVRRALPADNGVFSFTDLQPHTEYIIAPYLKDHSFTTSASVKTGEKGSVTYLPEIMAIRFMQNNTDKIITDTRSDIQWLPDQGKSFGWEEALEYARGLRAGCGEWRVPTTGELKFLCAPAKGSGEKKASKLNDLFQLQECCAWTSQRCAPETPKAVNLISCTTRCDAPNSVHRLLPVRAQK